MAVHKARIQLCTRAVYTAVDGSRTRPVYTAADMAGTFARPVHGHVHSHVMGVPVGRIPQSL